MATRPRVSQKEAVVHQTGTGQADGDTGPCNMMPATSAVARRGAKWNPSAYLTAWQAA